MRIAKNFKTSLTLLPLLAPLALSGTLRAQYAPPAQQESPQLFQGADNIPTIHTGVQLVVQDITVTDAQGHPITGLKPEDFRIFEDGRPQTIKNFEEHAPIDPALAEQRAAELAATLPPNTFTNLKAFKTNNVVVFLVDVMDNGASSGLRQGMIDYMKSAPLGTPYMILKLDINLHLRMEQDTTTDLDALRTVVLGKWDSWNLPPQLGSDDPRYPSWPVALSRRQIITALMAQLKQYLGAIPGRKTLAWIGGSGQMKIIDPATTDPPPTQVSVNPDTLEPIYSDPSRAPDLFCSTPGQCPAPKEAKTNPALKTFVADMTDNLAQAHIALYQVGCQPAPFADVPGGSYPVCAFHEMKDQITAIVDQSSHFYTITYTPTNQNWNGQPRKFHVEMADPTLRLQYRHSYLGGPNDTAVQRVAAPVETAASAAVLHAAIGPSTALQTAMGMGTVEPTQIVFEASATRAPTDSKDAGNQPAAAGNYLTIKYRREGYRDYTVHFRVHANELKLTQPAPESAYTGKLEFVAVVYDNQGQAVNGKREKATVSFDNLTDPGLQTASITGDLVIQVPAKGSYFLRLGVRDTATDRVGALEIPVDRIPLPK
jgi:VWFA-related protein